MYEEDSVVSVCVVIGEKNFLARIADVRDNELFIPSIDTANFTGFNRNRVFYEQKIYPGLVKEDIGIWKWWIADDVNNKIESELKKEIRFIEVIDNFKYKKNNELAVLLRRGISIPQCDHHILILFHNEFRAQAVLCAPSQLEVAGDEVHVKNDIFGLPCYDIKENDLLHTQATQGIRSRCLYRFLELPQNSSYFPIRSPEEAIKKIFQKRLSWNFIKTNNLGTRNEFSIMRRIMEALPQNDLIGDISEQCHCSKELAKRYWDNFKYNIDRYIRGEDIETEALRSLLEKDESLSNRLHEEWQRTHQQELNEEKNNFQQIQAEVEVQRNTLEKEREKLKADFTEFQRNNEAERARIQNEIVEAENCLNKTREEAEHYKTLGQESLHLVREKLSLAREEAAEFLADLALFGAHDEVTASVPSSDISGHPMPKARFLPGSIPTKGETVASLEEELEELEENLLRAGVNTERRSALASYLYGAFQSKTPLLLAGAQGTAIAHAISCTMTERYASVLDCCGEWDSTLLDEAIGSDDVVIIVKHPFQNRWIDHLLPEVATTGKMWIFVHPYTDDLPLEPSGMYQYLLPLVLDIFIDHMADTENMLCIRKSEGYKTYPSNQDIRGMTRHLKKLSRNLYLEMQVNRLMGFVCALSKESNEAFLRCGCLLFPLAIALGRKDIFLEEIIQKEQELDQADKTFLEESIGDIR